MRFIPAVQPSRREEKKGLGDRSATRAKSSLEDGKSKREGIGALQCKGQEVGIGNLRPRARS